LTKQRLEWRAHSTDVLNPHPLCKKSTTSKLTC